MPFGKAKFIDKDTNIVLKCHIKKEKKKEQFMQNSKLITPRKLQGFWELMPKEQMLFSHLLNTIEEVFKQNCFLPLDTPVLEYSEALLAKSGGDTDKEVYRFTKGDTDVCMRYDLTVPLARFVAMHRNELNFPFKRYQIGKVYRGERPQQGRFREFYQCDADIIGNESLSLVADAECVALFEKCFKALNLECKIQLSNRKMLAGIIEEIGQTTNNSNILILLDKIGKIGEENTLASLQDLGISPENAQKLIKISKINGKFDDISENLKNLSTNEMFLQGFAELEEVNKYLKLLGIKNCYINLSIIRGHDYYTGTVFEAFLNNDGALLAVGGGGRYENLCSYFCENKMPGVGMSIGITRLFDILLKQNYFDLSQTSEIDCAIITFDETFDAGLQILGQLREKGVKAECFYENKSFKSKMKEANKRAVKYVIIVGEDEVNSKNYTLKNMQTSEQQKLSLEEIINLLKSDRM